MYFQWLGYFFQEPKEKLIMNLRKEVELLQEENQHLRLLLDLAAKNGK